MRLPAFLIVALAAGAAAAPAQAASVSVTPPSDPVAGVPGLVGYAYDTDGFPQSLSIIARPASGPPCQASPTGDAAVAGGSGTRYLTGAPLEVKGAGGETLSFTFLDAAPTRVCAWLYRNIDEVTATTAVTVTPRLPRASIAVSARQVEPKAGGSDILLQISGELELARDPFAMVVPAGESCPPTYDEEVASGVFDRPDQRTTRLQGSFTETLQTRELLAYRRWRVCAYLQDGAEAVEALATATAIVDFVLKPQVLRRPRVKLKGRSATCDLGRWKAMPAAKVTATWHADGRRVGKGRAIALKKGWRKLTCEVVAKNRVGSAKARSKVVRPR